MTDKKHYSMKNDGEPGKNDGHTAGPSLNKTLSPEELEQRQIGIIKRRAKKKKVRDKQLEDRIVKRHKKADQLEKELEDIVARKVNQNKRYVKRGTAKAKTAEELRKEVLDQIKVLRAA